MTLPPSLTRLNRHLDQQLIGTCRPACRPWSIPGGDIDDCIERSALLDDSVPRSVGTLASIIRSIHLSVSYDQPAIARELITRAIDAGLAPRRLKRPGSSPDRRPASAVGLRWNSPRHGTVVCWAATRASSGSWGGDPGASRRARGLSRGRLLRYHERAARSRGGRRPGPSESRRAEHRRRHAAQPAKTARRWDVASATNHVGPFAFTEALIPHLRDGANVVFIRSRGEDPERKPAVAAGFRGGRYISGTGEHSRRMGARRLHPSRLRSLRHLEAVQPRHSARVRSRDAEATVQRRRTGLQPGHCSACPTIVSDSPWE